MEGALQLDGHGHGVFDQAASLAIWTRVELGHTHAFGGALSGHFHQPKLGDGQDVGPGLVTFEALPHELVDRLLVFARFHVDEIGDNETADVAQPHLPGDFVRRLQIGLKDGALHVFAAFVPAGIDIDRDESFGLVDHDVSAARQPDLAVESLLDLFVDAVFFEDMLLFLVELDAFLRARGNLRDQFLHPLDGGKIVANHRIYLLGKKIAHRALDEIGFLEKLVGRALCLHVFLNVVPLLEQQMEIADKKARALAGADGADDDAHAVGDFQFVEDLA